MAVPTPTLTVTYNKSAYTYGEAGYVTLTVEGADPESLTGEFSVEVDGVTLTGSSTTLLNHLVENWQAVTPGYTQDPAIPNRFNFTAQD